MKYLKTFEAEIKRTFDEWLKDPKAPKTDSYNYQFEFPVKKIFNIDDGYIDLDNLAEYLNQERGCDIYRDIANEIDLSSGLEEDDNIPTVTKEEVQANIDEYFYTWIKQSFNDNMGKFFRMYDLDFEEDYIEPKDFEDLKNSFNEDPLEKYYPSKEYNQDFKILSMKVTGLKNDNKIIGQVITNRRLSEDEIDSIKDFLEGQCSDGWGEGYDQSSQEKEEIHGLNFYSNIKPWWNDGYPEWYLEVKEV